MLNLQTAGFVLALIFAVEGHARIQDREILIESSTGHLIYTHDQAQLGNPEAPRLVAVHGMGDDSTTFEQVAKYFLEWGGSVTRTDVYGHGRSAFKDIELGRRIPKETKAEVLAEDVTTVIKKLKLKKFVLLGHSMGGAIVTQMAANPEISARIQALHMEAPYPYRLDHVYFHRSTGQPFDNYVKGEYGYVMWDPFYEIYVVPKARKLFFDAYLKKWNADPDNATAEQKTLADQMVDYVISICRGLREFYLVKRMENVPRSIPIHLTIGDKDELLPVALMDAVARSFTAQGFQLDYQVLPNTGHFIHHKNPLLIAQRLWESATGSPPPGLLKRTRSSANCGPQLPSK